MQALCQDLGFKLDLTILTGATAAIGICRRKGLGKVRHLAVADLWIQDKVRAQDFKLEKVAGTSNPADALTKYVDHSTLAKHLKTLSLDFESGRAEAAPTLTH